MPISQELFLSAQAGDDRALTQLLMQLTPDVRRYARRLCHRSSAIEDVVQEVLIVVYRRIGAVKNPAAFAGWVATVVSRLCLLPALMMMKGFEEIASADLRGHFAAMPTHDLRIDLIRALESLPETHRTVVILRDFEEMTIAEIAERTGLTNEATKSRLHRARVMVREYLLDERKAP